MATEKLILGLYVVPLVLCFHAFYLAAQWYPRLPDKIPMHFNFKGQADKWRQKDLFSVYLMPAANLFSFISICAILAFIHYDSGYLPDLFSFGFWIFTFSLVYLMYRSQIGIFQYALDTNQNIWSSIGSGLVLLTVACLLLVGAAWGYTRPVVSEATFCARIKNRQAVDIKDTFSKNDEQASLLIVLKNVMGKHQVKMEWRNPAGANHFVYTNKTHAKKLAKYVPMWSYIYLDGNQENIMVGQWQVDVYVDDKLSLAKKFTVTE